MLPQKLIYINAEDILLYRTISSEPGSTLLQNDTKNLIKWSNTWQLPFNFEFLHATIITTTYYMDMKALKQVTLA